MEIKNPCAPIGSIMEYEGKDCLKCEGSGVIAYKAVKEIESGIEPDEK